MRLKMLIERRSPKFRVGYIMSGLVLTFIGVIGFHYGAFIIFWPIAALCFSLAIYPTLITWALTTGIFIFGSIFYSNMLREEILAMQSDVKVSYTLRNDPIAFPAFVVIIIFVTLFVVIAKPTIVKNAQPDPGPYLDNARF